MNANNANYNNNNKSGITQKIESNFQLQYKGKMNNNKAKPKPDNKGNKGNKATNNKVSN